MRFNIECGFNRIIHVQNAGISVRLEIGKLIYAVSTIGMLNLKLNYSYVVAEVLLLYQEC